MKTTPASNSVLRTAIAATFLGGFLIASVNRCHAGENLLTNGSFEQGTNPELSTELVAGSTALTGWRIVSGNIDYIGSRWTVFDGLRCIDLSGSVGGTIAQQITGLTVGKRYRFAFQMAVNPEAPPASTDLEVAVGGATNRFTVTQAGTTSNLGWQLKSMEFEAPGEATTLVLHSLNPGWAGPVLDALNLEAIGEAPALLANGSFELGTDPGISTQIDSVNSTALTGWTVQSGNIDYIGNRWVAADGVRCVDLSGSIGGSIEQSISGLTIGQMYRLAFKMAANPEAPPASTDLLVIIGSISNRFSVIAPGNTSNLGWTDQALDFVANETTTRLKLISLNPGWAGPVLDKLSLEPAITPPPPPPAIVYDVSQDFSTAANPNGVWQFGWKPTLDGQLTPLTFGKAFGADNGVPLFCWQLSDSQGPGVCKVIGPGTANSAGGQFVAPAGTVYMAPGNTGAPQNFGAVRFTVPAGASGGYRIETAVRDVFDGSFQGDTDFHVLKNGTELFGRFLAPHSTAGYTNDLTLAAGDTIDFVLGRGQDNNAAGSLLKLVARVSSSVLPPPPPPPPLATTFDVSGDYSTAANPGPAWRYGWKSTLDGPLGLLSFSKSFGADNGVPIHCWQLRDNAGPSVCKVIGPGTASSAGAQFTAPPGTVYFAPGNNGAPENFGVVRFTLPVGGSGYYRIATAVRDVFDGSFQGDTDFHVLKNGVELYGRNLAPHTTAGYTNVVSLSDGDTIDFVVGRGLDARQEGSLLKLMASLTKTDAPQNLLANGSFEIGLDPGVSTQIDAVNSTSILGWTVQSGNIDYIGSRWVAADGIRCIDLSGAIGGSIEQRLTGLSVGQRYQLTFKMAVNPEAPPPTTELLVIVGGVSNRYSATTVGTPSNLGWIEKAFAFEATTSNPLLRLVSLNPGWAGPVLDNLSISTNTAPPPPENTLVKNGSFELGQTPGVSTNVNAPNTTMVTSWLIERGSIDYIGTRWAAGDGARSIDLSGETPGRISQPIGDLVPGQHYRLSFLMAGNPELLSILGVIKSLRASVGTASREFTFDTTGKTASQMGWEEKHFDFTATSSTAKLSFESLVENIGGPALDRVRITPIESRENSAPTATSQSLVITEGTSTPIILLAQDPDGDGLTYIVGSPAHGTLSGTAPNLVYTPNPDFSGSDSFNFRVSDGTLQSAEATITISIRPLQDPPVAVAKLFCVIDTTGEGAWVAIAANGTNATITLDGTGSFDTDLDPLQFHWFADGNLQPIANASIATNKFELGSHFVTLVVDDGHSFSEKTIEFEVITIKQALDDLCLQIDNSDLDKNQKRPLIASCAAAQDSFRRGNTTAALNQLSALREKLKAHFESGDSEVFHRWHLWIECIGNAAASLR